MSFKTESTLITVAIVFMTLCAGAVLLSMAYMIYRCAAVMQ